MFDQLKESNRLFFQHFNTLSLVSGSANANTSLNAFDKSLLKAGVGNLNLVKISSIMPVGCEIVELPSIPMGSLVPIAYGSICSDKKGETIAAAISVAIPKDKKLCGLIMEYEGFCSKKEAEKIVIEMAKEGFEIRDWEIDKILSISSECVVKKVGCAFAGAVLWYKENKK